MKIIKADLCLIKSKKKKKKKNQYILNRNGTEFNEPWIVPALKYNNIATDYPVQHSSSVNK